MAKKDVYLLNSLMLSLLLFFIFVAVFVYKLNKIIYWILTCTRIQTICYFLLLFKSLYKTKDYKEKEEEAKNRSSKKHATMFYLFKLS